MDLELTSALGVAWLEESPLDRDPETQDSSPSEPQDSSPSEPQGCLPIYIWGVYPYSLCLLLSFRPERTP